MVRLMCRLSIALPLVLGALVSGPAVAAAGENTPCSASRAKPQITLVDKGAGSALYATQELGVKLTQAGESGGAARSIEAPGARVDIEGAEGSGFAALLWIDRAGPLTVAVRIGDRDPALDPANKGADTECTHTVSKTFTISPASVSKAGRLSRPRLVDRRRNLWYRRVAYSFSVLTTGPAADHSPITVRARAIGRAKYPGARSRAVSRVYGLRTFDFVEQKSKNGCGSALICQRKGPRGFSKSLGVGVEELGSRGLKVRVDVPTGYFSRNILKNRIIPTPFGVDVEVVQSGRRIARLRAAGRCDSYGQAADCSFKKVRTKP